METVYRTFDGRIFREPADAMQHEQSIIEHLEMWDRDGNPTTDTRNAMFVHMHDETGAKMFLDAAKANEDITEGIGSAEDYGFYYWNEYQDYYQYVDSDVLRVLVKLLDAKN